MEFSQKKLYVNIFGLFLIFGGLSIALTFGGNQGFSGDLFQSSAYIGGFLTAFIGVYFAFLYGRTRSRDVET